MSTGWRRSRTEAPPQAEIKGLVHRTVPPQAVPEEAFVIRPSLKEGPALVTTPPDLGIRADCLAEIGDPSARRHRHPFTNCTHYGPRFTVIRGLPHDRPAITMADFPLCAERDVEYRDPADRRFHAQPIACPDCGPALHLLNAGKKTGRLSVISSDDPSGLAPGAVHGLDGGNVRDVLCVWVNARGARWPII